MYVSTRVLIGIAILSAALMIAQPGLTVPADYSTFPHLNSTIDAPGDNLDVEGFPIFGTDYFGVCNINSGLVLYQVNGQSLTRISDFSALGRELDLEVQDWFGYLATTGGLEVVSLALPQTPVTMGFLSLPGGDIHGLSVAGNLAFVACGSSGLAIVDITQHSSMFVVAWYGGDVENAHADGDRVGVINNGRFELVDVSDPTVPALLGFCESVSYFDYGRCVTQGDIVYTDAGGQVDKWDFTDPAQPVLDAIVPHIYLPSNNYGTLRILDTELQVTGAFYLGYFDFTTGALLRESGQVWNPRAVDVQGGLIVTAANEALHVYSKGALANPSPSGVFNPSGKMWPEGIMMGDVLYGRSQSQLHSLTAVDLNADAAHLWDFDYGFDSGTRDMVHRGDLLAILSWTPYRLKLVTVSRYGVVERGTLELPDLLPTGDAMAFLGDDHLVVYDYDYGSTSKGLRILDISDPDNPQQVSTYSLTNPSLESGLWTTDTVILVGGRHYVQMIDAQDPLNPTPGADIYLGAQTIFVARDHLYSVSTAFYGADLTTRDISDPSNPVEIDQMPLPVLRGEFVINGSYAYQTNTGLVLDLTSPDHPSPAGNISLANPSLSTMEEIMAGDQYLLVGDLSLENNNSDLHYIQTQGGTGEVSPVPEIIPVAGCGLDLQASPNPFNPRVTLQFKLPATAETSVEVFDVMGRKVAYLGSKQRDAGVQQVTWDGTDLSGQPLPSGIYLARVQAGSLTESLKVVLAK